jgi:hypothetical protein
MKKLNDDLKKLTSVSYLFKRTLHVQLNNRASSTVGGARIAWFFLSICVGLGCSRACIIWLRALRQRRT